MFLLGWAKNRCALIAELDPHLGGAQIVFGLRTHELREGFISALDRLSRRKALRVVRLGKNQFSVTCPTCGRAGYRIEVK